MIRKVSILLFLAFLPALFFAQGGMWLPIFLEKLNEKEMQSLGCKLDADDIYNVNKSSVKDAICLFDGSCTGEIVSPQGLVLTNHHCGFDAIQQLSTLEKNYIEDGFWAKTQAEELPAKDLFVMFVSRMEDVTALALKDVSDMMSEKDRQSQIEKNMKDIRKNVKKESWEEIMIRPFYAGNQYFMFVTQTYRDVRLVGTPPSSIGKFGADTDNWVWPRHTGDFSIFRVYADKDNRPAEYSPDNRPYVPKHFLPVSLDGVEEGDFTMVYGFPGATNEYLPAEAVRQTGEVLNPAKVAIRDRALKIMDGFMRGDPDVKIAYIARYANIANAWKKWLGEMQGLEKYGALEKKRAYDAEFNRRVRGNVDWNQKYTNLLPRLEKAHKDIEPYALTRDFFLETCQRNNEIFSQVQALVAWVETFEKNGETFFINKKPEVEASMNSFYKDYRPAVDKAVFAAMLEMYAGGVREEWGAKFVKDEAAKHGGFAGLADFIFQNSVVPDKGKFTALLSEKPATIVERLKKDPAYAFYKTLFDNFFTNVMPKLQELQPQITALQRQYMAAQLEVFKEKKFFPDANGTLRLTYGNVRPYRPRDGVMYEHMTYLDGVMEKYVPGDYEFNVPKKLIELWKSKDYGRYATTDGRMPVAFIGANHTTSGNSGSPALDAKGNLIGINFDRVWEGTMSDLNYDPAICRNIMVDIRYVLFITEKLGGAKNITDEMTMVKGQIKRKKKKCK